MSGMNLFAPQKTGTVSITSATSSANVALLNKPSSMTVRVKNLDATNIAYIEFGTSSAVAATIPNGATPGSMPIGPGETAGFTLPGVPCWAAAICSAGTPLVCFTPGDGS